MESIGTVPAKDNSTLKIRTWNGRFILFISLPPGLLFSPGVILVATLKLQKNAQLRPIAQDHSNNRNM